ncbi:MAG: dTDP-4-dehydrorhamnose 3,5-epimerase family protein [Deltaproteobacteria bacterium]|nr:dTDP-4-dehydrorhamnose 3,5-epimerase family protein [Deltaproteobacteria bacterium]
MTEIEQAIVGVVLVDLDPHEDERGLFAELFRADRLHLAQRPAQANLSESRAGVLRGLHYHHAQYDYWIPMGGRLRVGLADLRRGSPSWKTAVALDLDAAHPKGLLIPAGVAHGYYAIEDARLLYLVERTYDGSDEWGVAWNDPDLGVPWDIDGEPILSERDRNNQRFVLLDDRELPTVE